MPELDIFDRIRSEAEARYSAKHGFDDRDDAAAKITNFFEAWANRYSPLRDDPFLKPILEKALARYQELRVYDFTYAYRVAHTEAIRAILAAGSGGG